MCGICGYTLSHQKIESSQLISNMANTIKHRGPDNQGEYIFENFALAHRRLSIIDLTNHANQPMLDLNKDVCLVYNGEIYNFKKLKSELEKRGHRFLTNSDTEVILNSYLEWGEKSFSMFNGMFAFAILDKRNNQRNLYLVRDRAGIKPLFYSFDQRNLIFASELKPILKAPWIKKNISKQTLFYYLKHGHIPTPLSIFDNINQLEPGNYIHFKDNQINIHTYWDTNNLLPKNQFNSEKEILSELNSTFIDITKRQTISDVPLGCFLSGGIDSSLLVAYYSEINSNPIKTFSIGYSESEFDESYYAKIVAEKFKTEHHEIIVSPKDLHQLIPLMPDFYDQPFSDPTLLPTMLLSKFAREHVTVALSGDGGDELFFGYLYHEMLYKMRLLKNIPYFIRKNLFESIRKTIRLCMGGKVPLRIQQICKFLEIMQFKDSAEFIQYFVGTIGPLRMDRISNLINGDINITPSLYTPILNSVKTNKWSEIVEQIFFKTFMLNTVLQKTDRASMAYSLEVRVPFLDNELLDFSSRVPFKFKYNGGIKKYILRQMLKEKLPPEIVDRKKQGFSIPLREWLRGDLNYLVQDFLSEKSLQKDDYFNPKEVQGLINEHMSNKANHSHLIWSMICFQIWKEKYL